MRWPWTGSRLCEAVVEEWQVVEELRLATVEARR